MQGLTKKLIGLILQCRTRSISALESHLELILAARSGQPICDMIFDQTEQQRVVQMGWYIEALRKYAVFKGRASRAEYWMFVLLNTLIFCTISLLEGLATGSAKLGFTSRAYQLAVALPFAAVHVRRLHDVGRSGWWFWVPVVNFALCCLDSKVAENDYGKSPKE